MTTRATRGRPRKFDPDQVLQEAVELFWEKGYRATTTRDLETSLGITQSSLYNAFGSKRDLLLQAIDRYERHIEHELFDPLTNDGGYSALGAFFTELSAWVLRNEHRGCMVVNLMAGESGDPKIVERVQAYRDKIRSGLAAALARVDGLDPVVAAARAELLLAAVLGLHITARTARNHAEVEGITFAICDQIEAWDRASTG